MAIIIKYIWKNICEKKLRTALILFTVVISAALFFASSAISDTTIKIYTQGAKKFSGSSDIMITPGDKFKTPYLYNVSIPGKYLDSMEYVIGVIQGNGFYKYSREEKVKMVLQGVDWNESQKMNPAYLLQESSLQPFDGKKIVICKDTADKYGLKLGNVMEFIINGKEYKFEVCGISAPVGPFLNDGKTIVGVVPKDILGSIYAEKGMVSGLYIKLKEPYNKPENRKIIIQELTNALTRYKVKDVLNLDEAQATTKMLTVVFNIVLVIVLLLSIFIIYSTFKVITMERLPTIGTFRSVGATKRTTNLVLLTESALYGVIGGVIGCFLGLGILHLISMLIAPAWGGGAGGAEVVYNIYQIISAFAIAVVLCVLSSLVPIVKTSKLPLKDVVLNKVEMDVKTSKTLKLIIGIILLIFVIAVPRIVQGAAAIYLDALCLVLIIYLISLLTPYIVAMFVNIFEYLYMYIFGNEGILAVKNLRGNKSIMGNTVMIAIGIASLLMISTVSQSVILGIVDTFSNANYDIQFTVPNMSRGTLQSINAIDGVDGTCGFYMAPDVKVENSASKITYLEGIDKGKFLSYFKINFIGGAKAAEAAVNQLDSGRNIILNRMHKSLYGVKVGDTIVLNLDGNEKRTYTVIGFMDTMWMGGNYAIISNNFFKADFKREYYDYVRIKTNGSFKEVLKTLKQKFSDSTIDATLTSELKGNIIVAFGAMFTVLQGFTIMAILIGILGVLNNVLISFIQRKRSLALFRSIGMNKQQIVKMIFIEAFTGGLIGGITGIISGVLLISTMPFILREVMATVPINYSVYALLGALLAGVVITVVASISPAAKTSKFNIIESLKYE